MNNLHQFKDQFTLLLEAGFIAVNQQDADAASKLFKAASILQPENTLPTIGMGYIEFLSLELNKAAQTFENVLKKEPNNEMAKALLGLALAMTPNQVSKAEKILTETGSHSSDKAVKNLTSDALKFIDKFVKKSASPAEVRKPKK